MRDPRRIRCTYYIECVGDPARAAASLAGEQSSGTFLRVPGESDRIRERHAAEVIDVTEIGRVPPSLPSRTEAAAVSAARIVVEFPMENCDADIAATLTMAAGNLFELGDLYACRLLDIDLPDEYLSAHRGPAFGIAGTRTMLHRPEGPMIGTIIKPNVGQSEDEFRQTVRALAMSAIDLIKDDELMSDPRYLPLAHRVRVATEEISRAEATTGHPTLYAFNISGDISGLQQRYDTVLSAGGRCVMLNVPIMGLPALQYLRTFSELPIHGHRAGLAASMRHPGLGVDYCAWQKLARLAGADHLHVSGLRSKFYETDDEVAQNIRHLLSPLGDTEPALPTLSSGQNVFAAEPTYAAVHTTDVLMLAGGGIAAHPDGFEAGVRSLRQAWSSAVVGAPLTDTAEKLRSDGDSALAHAVDMFSKVGVP